VPIPADPILRAAQRWLEMLPGAGTARCRSLFSSTREYSDIAPTQYEAAHAWLREAGLLDDLDNAEPARERIFKAAVSATDLAWFRDADMHVRAAADMPVDASNAARTLGLDADDAFAAIRSAWGKVDTAARERIGAAGELALVALLEKACVGRIEHLAAHSDSHGYDIAVHAAQFTAHIEAKSTTRRGRLTVYLSRNEYETARRDPQWIMVAVRLTDDLELAAVATIPLDWITSQIPADRGDFGRWESCALEVPPSMLEPGIPGLRPILGQAASRLLKGEPAWPG